VYAHEELKTQLTADWDNLMEHIRAVNSDLNDRFYGELLTFDLDTAQDRLKVVIGKRPASTYTQGANNIYFDLDVDTDTIAAVTIRDVSEYMTRKQPNDHVWTSLLEILRLVKTIEVPPVIGRDSGRDAFARGLQELIFV
jgi:hypothetical protein